MSIDEVLARRALCRRDPLSGLLQRSLGQVKTLAEETLKGG